MLVSQDGHRDTRGLYITKWLTVYDEGFFVEHRFGNGGHGGWKSTSIHSFVEKGKDLEWVGITPRTQRVHGFRTES